MNTTKRISLLLAALLLAGWRRLSSLGSSRLYQISMSMLKKTGAALVLSSLSLGAFGYEVHETYPEIQNCGQYIEARRVDTPALRQNINRLVAWEWGYLSAYNGYANDQQVAIPDRPTILAFLDSYCAVNPLKHMAYANQNLIIGIGGRLK